MTDFAANWQIIRVKSTGLILNRSNFSCVKHVNSGESVAGHSMKFLIALSAEVVLRITGVKGG